MNGLFLSTYKIELIKLVKRKDTLMLWLMPVLSFFYAAGAAANSSMITYNGTDSVDALSFAGSMFEFIHGLFIFYIIFAVITARTLGNEIEDKSIQFYIPRLRNRNTIYDAKCLSLITVFLVSFAVFLIVTFTAYFTLVVQRTDIADGLLYSSGTAIKNIGWFVSVTMAFVFSMLLVLMLSVRFRSITAVCMFLFIFVVLSFAAQFPYVQYISPFYYISSIGTEGSDDMLLTSASAVLGVLCSVVFSSLGKYAFSKKDL